MTDLSPREKALVEAARLARDTFRHMALDSIADTLEQSLRAYDPPKPKVPQIPAWEELDKETCRKIGESYPCSTGFREFYENIRALTSKEAE